MKKNILLFLFSFLAVASYSKPYFKYTTNLENAYQKILELRLGAAENYLNKEKKQAPENYLVYFFENYIDCIKVFISEDYSQFKKLEPIKYTRLSTIEKGDANSPYYLYTQATIRLHWMLVRSKFGETMTAIRELKKASQLLEQNKKKFPDFMPNLQTLGTIHIMVGAIPEDLNWGKNLLGLNGDIKKGIKELQQVVGYAQKNDYPFEAELLIMLSYLQLQLNQDPDGAWKTMQNARLDPQKSPIVAYMKAWVALYSKHTTTAVQILETFSPNNNADQLNIPQWDYLLGSAKLFQLDPQAETYLKRYAQNFGGRHHIKQAYEKLAYNALIVGNEAGYRTYAQLCQTKGRAETETDKKAAKNMAAPSPPNSTLLKANLLFDGGFYERSLDILERLNATDFKDEREQILLSYLIGRNYQGQKNHTKALQTYKETIEKGSNHPSYYACNAALQIGVIYEQKNMKTLAKQFYQKCLSIKPEEYASSLHARAKAGLARVE